MAQALMAKASGGALTAMSTLIRRDFYPIRPLLLVASVILLMVAITAMIF